MNLTWLQCMDTHFPHRKRYAHVIDMIATYVLRVCVKTDVCMFMQVGDCIEAAMEIHLAEDADIHAVCNEIFRTTSPLPLEQAPASQSMQ